MKRNWVLKVAALLTLTVTATTNAENILFIGGQEEATQGDDGFVLEYLEEKGHTVTYLQAGVSQPGDEDGMDAIILSSTPGSGDMRGKWQDSDVPILQWEEALVRWDHGDPDGNLRMSEFSRNGQGRETSIINIVESAVGHPLAAGLEAGEHEIFDDFTRTPQQFGILAPGLIRIAELDPEVDDEVDFSIYVDANGDEQEGAPLVLTAIEKGAELGPPGEGFEAPARRVNFPIEDTGFDLLNDTGLKLFDCSLEWILGRDCTDDNPGVAGDYDNSGARDVADLDLQAAAMGGDDLSFDLNEDGAVTFADREQWVVGLSNTFIGDANFDGEFNSSDFVTVFGAAKYETGQAATWSEGDWNGDGQFNSADFVAAFGGGGYESGPRDGNLQTVPEPSSIFLVGIGLLAFAARRRR